MAVLPLREFRRIDLNCEGLGLSVADLMASAGAALARSVAALGPDQRAVILCGKGNNGGDGLAAARILLDEGRHVEVVVVEPPAGPAAQEHLASLEATVSWSSFDRSGRPDMVVDCLLGSGLLGEPRPPYDDVIEWINEAGGRGATVISCDVPSGLGTQHAVVPNQTVTFHAEKEGMAGHSGEILVADIGIPWQAEAHVGMGDLVLAYRRSGGDSHKGDNGRILVVGGGPFHGAPHYAGMGACRTGADLVHVATTMEAARVIACWGPALLVHGVEDSAALTPVALARIEPLLERVDAVVAGPGLGTGSKSRAMMEKLLELCAERDLPVVVDADGLDGVTDEMLKQHGGRMVLTPHGKEFLDLTGMEADRDHVEKYARQNGVTVLRKGALDVIAGPEATRECHRGDPAMTVGGTGDVLAGIVAALLARGAEPFDAACGAAYLAGRAGESAAARKGEGMTAAEMHEAIPDVLLEMP